MHWGQEVLRPFGEWPTGGERSRLISTVTRRSRLRVLGLAPRRSFWENCRTTNICGCCLSKAVIGLALFLFAWYRIIMSAPREIRYIGLIAAIYSFSENNLDNFPFMALFDVVPLGTGCGRGV